MLTSSSAACDSPPPRCLVFNRFQLSVCNATPRWHFVLLQLRDRCRLVNMLHDEVIYEVLEEDENCLCQILQVSTTSVSVIDVLVVRYSLMWPQIVCACDLHSGVTKPGLSKGLFVSRCSILLSGGDVQRREIPADQTGHSHPPWKILGEPGFPMMPCLTHFK